MGVATVDEVLLLAVSSEFGHVERRKARVDVVLRNVNGEIRQMLVSADSADPFRT